jgi:hypothetical protein
MTIIRARRWREWLRDTFIRGGYFSLRPLPTTEAERREAAEAARPSDTTITRLDLESSSNPRE